MGHIYNLKFTNIVDKAHESISNALACILCINFDKTPTEANVDVVDYNSDTNILKIRITLYETARCVTVSKIFSMNINDPFMLTNLRKELKSLSNSSDEIYMKDFVMDWISKNGIVGYPVHSIFRKDGHMVVNFGTDRLFLRLPIEMKKFEHEILLKAYFFNLLKEMEEDNDN